MIHPPQQHDECGKSRDQSEIGSLADRPPCIERVDHIRMNFDSARLLSTFGEWGEPLISQTFCREADQDDLILELCGVRAAVEHLPCGHMPEGVLVARESNVHGLRANHLRGT